jgi:hypothetical protein
MKREVDGFLFSSAAAAAAHEEEEEEVGQERNKERNRFEGFHSSVDHDWMVAAAAAAGRYT